MHSFDLSVNTAPVFLGSEVCQRRTGIWQCQLAGVCVYARMFFPYFLKACIRDYIRPKAARNSCHHVASASRRPHETDIGTQHCNLATPAETRSRGVCLCMRVCGYVRVCMLLHGLACGIMNLCICAGLGGIHVAFLFSNDRQPAVCSFMCACLSFSVQSADQISSKAVFRCGLMTQLLADRIEIW